MSIEIREMSAPEQSSITALARLLVECVQTGASVSFMADLTQACAEAFFQDAFHSIARKERVLLAAFEGGELVGTVQVRTGLPPNQPHRADVAKLLVHPAARGRGIGELLMKRAEEAALNAGKTLLELDTATGESGERLYTRLAWTRVGVIPNYALFPDGRPCATTIFYKELKPAGASSPPPAKER